MEKYLYLTEVEWSKAWISGGNVPVSLASSYLSDERSGTLTPDENMIYESNVPVSSLLKYGIAIGKGCSNIRVINPTFNGKKHIDIHIEEYRSEDGLILSFCNSFSKDIALKLGKKCCVKVNDMELLRKKIDKQIGCKGKMGSCEYTTTHRRNHFLKSVEDSWQEEYRIFWKYPKDKVVVIPSGIAELIAVF
jgi:hypothetical protein